ncbi:helix-turn-helix domain-containing protein [Candidatus Micrarchaeota archaeon]|nr:helix-turn-helix domain-containing protein [Candidatus Micrarchaeota archaeon]
MDISALREGGLTDGEIKVYLALLELGSTTTGPIVQKSGIARSIIHQILEKLMQKGLVSYTFKEKTKYYEAAEPNRILDYMEEKEEKLKKNKEDIKKLLPNLSALRRPTQETEVHVYKGFKGTITVHERTYEKLKKGDEYFYMVVPAYQPGFHHDYWMKDHERRAKAGIICKMLFDQSTDPKILGNRNSYKGCEARYMPLDIKPPAAFMAYKDVVMIAIPSEKPITIEIINQEIADSFWEYFKAFWKRSKPFKE